MRIALAVVALLAACTDSGEPPEISNITAAPLVITVGAQATVSGTFTFTDEDGDLAKLAASAVLPDGSRAEFVSVPINQLGGVTTGTLNWAVIAQPPTPGVYELELHVTDESDNDSNTLTVSLTAQ